MNAPFPPLPRHITERARFIRATRIFECAGCRRPAHLNDLDDDMRCAECAQPRDDEPMSGLQDSIRRANEYRLRWED